jgi:hypothetical protein
VRVVGPSLCDPALRSRAVVAVQPFPLLDLYRTVDAVPSSAYLVLRENLVANFMVVTHARRGWVRPSSPNPGLQLHGTRLICDTLPGPVDAEANDPSNNASKRLRLWHPQS